MNNFQSQFALFMRRQQQQEWNDKQQRHSLLLLMMVRSLLMLCISYIIYAIFENALKLKNILVTKIISTLAHIHLIA